MSYREVSEIRDGMRIDWDMPIQMDDGIVLRCDIYRPIKPGRHPVIMTLRPLRQVAALRRSLQRAVAADVRDPPRRADRLDQQVSVLGGGRSREVGAGRLCRASASTAAAPAARRASSTSGRCARRWTSRNASNGPACSRGRTARSGSTASRTTPRTSGSAPRCSPSTSPRSALGGRGRFLPRHGASRRHLLQRLHQGLVGEPGLHAAARPRLARLSQPHDRRLGVGAARADRRGARRQPPQFLRGLPRAKARHRRLLAVAHAGLVEGQGAAVVVGQLGRPGPASARQFRGLRPLGVEAEVARSARPRALDAFLYGLRCRASEEVLRPFPERREDRLGQAAEGAPAGPPQRQVRRAAREGMAAQAHEVDQVLPRSRDFRDVDQAAGEEARASPTRASATASPS